MSTRSRTATRSPPRSSTRATTTTTGTPALVDIRDSRLPEAPGRAGAPRPYDRGRGRRARQHQRRPGWVRRQLLTDWDAGSNVTLGPCSVNGRRFLAGRRLHRLLDRASWRWTHRSPVTAFVRGRLLPRFGSPSSAAAVAAARPDPLPAALPRRVHRVRAGAADREAREGLAAEGVVGRVLRGRALTCAVPMRRPPRRARVVDRKKPLAARARGAPSSAPASPEPVQ